MTTSYTKRRNKKILALLLSSVMLAAAGTSLAACGSSDADVDDSEKTYTESDDARIKNGSFEFFDDGDGKNLIITSPTSWSKSNGSSAQGTASSSKAASGIVDTADEAWNDLTTSSGLPHTTEAEAKKNWDNLTAKDKLEFYDVWEEENDDKELSDLDFYDAETDDYNITIDDVPDCENPGTHYATSDEKNEHVLMLHNTYTDGRGTAQKYTSSSTVTLEAGTSAVFSVWVKTSDMTFNGTSEGKGSEVISGRGAYIGVTHTVGGTTLDQMQVKNINTEQINPDNENNGWVQYTFYFKGCSYATSTFTVVLGLGQGGGTDKFEYVDGYAFFDDVECTIVSNDDYDETVEALVSENKLDPDDIVDVFTDPSDKLFYTDKDYKGVFNYAIDLHNAFDAYTLQDSGLKVGLTEEKSGNTTYVSGKPSGGSPAAGTELYGQLNFATDNDVTGLYTLDELAALKASNKYLGKIYDNALSEYPEQFDKDILLLMSADGAAYTATLRDDAAFTLAPDSYLMISFWLKTSDLSGFTGATVTVHESEGSNTSSLSSLSTSSITTVDIDKIDPDTGEVSEEEDIYKSWQQCFLFLKNETTSDKSFYLTFSFGPTTIVGSTPSSYYPGFAAFTNFETFEMSKQQFGYVSTGTYATSVTLTGDELTSTAGFDSAASIPEKQIEEGLANPLNYKGVYGASGFVSETGTDNTVNGNEYAGLINKKYAANYREEMNSLTGAEKENYWLYKLANAYGVVIDDQDEWWNTIFGTSTQPLLIYNDERQAYGFIGSATSVSSSTYSTVSVRVKASLGSTAYLYLIDTTDSRYDKPLTVNTLAYTYWYDDSGNVCAKDPSDSSFDKKKDIAFYLNEDNGLYEVNRNWSGYTADMNGKYYANLSNYEKDEKGNLIVAEGGVSYNYDSSVWRHDGNDGIAFYFRDGKYYAYSDYKTEVTDLATVTALTPRYTNVNAEGGQGDAKNLVMTVTGTGEWVTCTFYIHTGSEAKNYRLEVWSGSRDALEKNAAGSYVIFDSASPTSVDSFSDLTAEAIDAIIEAHNATHPDDKWSTEKDVRDNYASITYYAYSFYDSPSFLRYDSTLDEDDVGNKYTSYTPSSYAEGIAYLYYEDPNADPGSTLYTMFVDYSFIDVSVTADSTDDTTDDTTEETTSGDTNMWLFVSSLVIAIALVVAVVGLIIQKIVKKAHLKKARAAMSNASSLNAAKRRYARKSAAEKEAAPAPEKKAEPAPENNNDPYDD